MVFLLAASGLLYGCRLPGGGGSLTVRLPVLPESWDGFSSLVTFRLVYPGSEGDTRELPGLAPGSEVRIPYPPGSAFPVSAYPGFASAGFSEGGMRPAGGVYPLSLSSRDVLELSWEDGFLARSLFGVYRNTRELDWINLAKLQETIRKTAPGNPWVLDERKLVRPLIYGRFYGGFVSPGDCVSIPVPGETAGWVWGDVFFEVLTQESGQEVFYPGLHRRISPGGEAWMDLFVDDRGWVLVIMPRGQQEGGFF